MLKEIISLAQFGDPNILVRGPYSTLYKGIWAPSDLQVVIKLWPAAHISTEQAYDIRLEVAALQQLDHPHILPVLQVEVVEQAVALVYEYAQHGSLATLMGDKHSPLPLQKALEVTRQIGQGLQAAHENKIVHGNLAPNNILFVKADMAVLTDFHFNSIVATLKNYIGDRSASLYKYMAPEQFQGMVDEKTDQYALGCIVYELLTGQPPFSGSARATLQQRHMHGQPEPLRNKNQMLPAQIEAAVLRTLEKDPRARHESIQAFLEDLEHGIQLVSAEIVEHVESLEKAKVGLPDSEHVDVDRATTPETLKAAEEDTHDAVEQKGKQEQHEVTIPAAVPSPVLPAKRLILKGSARMPRGYLPAVWRARKPLRIVLSITFVTLIVVFLASFILLNTGILSYNSSQRVSRPASALTPILTNVDTNEGAPATSIPTAPSTALVTPSAAASTANAPPPIAPTAQGVQPTALPISDPNAARRSQVPIILMPTRTAVTVVPPAVVATAPVVPTTAPASNAPATPAGQGAQGVIQPIFECAQPQGQDGFLLKFGYINNSSSAVNIPIGSANTLQPSSFNGQQVTTFSPGRQRAVLQINVNGNTSVTWTVDGSSATSSTSSVTASC